MKPALVISYSPALLAWSFAAPADPSNVASQGELEKLLASASDATPKRALPKDAKAIPTAAADLPHVEAVTRTEGAKVRIKAMLPKTEVKFQ
jgi:hypothetical protein